MHSTTSHTPTLQISQNAGFVATGPESPPAATANQLRGSAQQKPRIIQRPIDCGATALSRASPPIPRSLRTAGILGAVSVVVAILYLARDVLIPIALAFLLTFLLVPVVRRLERLRFPRVAAVLLTVGLFTFLVAGLGWLVEVQIVDLASKAPAYESNLRHKISQLHPAEGSVLAKLGGVLSRLTSDPKKTSAEPHPPSNQPAPTAEPDPNKKPTEVIVVSDQSRSLGNAKELVSRILSPLATVGIVLVFAVFILLKREDVRNRLIRLLGPREMHVTTPALDEAAQRVGRYLLCQLMTNACSGLLIGTGFLLLDIPGALVWGLLVALLRFLPYVGIWVAAIPPIVLAISSSTGWTDPLLAIAIVVGVEVIISNAVEPFLFGTSVGVSPLAIFAAAVFWGWLWGPVGLLLATPLTVCLAVIGSRVPTFQFLEVLLSDEPVLTPEAQLYQRALAGDTEEAGSIVAAFAKDKQVFEVVDQLLLPAIRLAESVRHRGPADEDRDRTVTDTFALVIEDFLGRAPVGPPRPPTGRAVLCLPARDSADVLVARMLVRLLSEQGVSAETVSNETLASEQLDLIETTRPAAVCISAVPPGTLVHTRVMCKRIRARFPDLPIVAGLWFAEAPAPSSLRDLTAAIHVETTIQHAVSRLRALAECTPPDNSPEAGKT